jgi:prephenate dehydrogenase
MALALKAQSEKIQCFGWDADLEKYMDVEKSAAFRSLPKKRKDVFRNADLVILNIPPEEMQDTLREMNDSAPSKAVLVNIYRLHVLPDQWVKEIMGKDTPFVSILPALDHSAQLELSAANADLLSGRVAMISIPAWTNPAVLDVAVDLAVLIGSVPVFADAYEVDGLIAANLLLPEMASAALMLAVSGQPSWRDGQMLAGRTLNQATTVLETTAPAAIAQSMQANRDNAVRVLDDMIEELQHIRRAFAAEDAQALEEHIAQAAGARQAWLKQRRMPAGGRNVTSSIPTAKHALERMLERAE